MTDKIEELIIQQDRLIQAINTLNQLEPRNDENGSWLFYRQMVLKLSQHVDASLFSTICTEACKFYADI